MNLDLEGRWGRVCLSPQSVRMGFSLGRAGPKGWVPPSNPREQVAWAEDIRMPGQGLQRTGWGMGCFGPSHPPRQPWASSPQVNHLRCLHEFVESQTTYYAQCYRHMLDLQKQLGRCPPGSRGSQPRPPQARKAP